MDKGRESWKWTLPFRPRMPNDQGYRIAEKIEASCRVTAEVEEKRNQSNKCDRGRELRSSRERLGAALPIVRRVRAFGRRGEKKKRKELNGKANPCMYARGGPRHQACTFERSSSEEAS